MGLKSEDAYTLYQRFRDRAYATMAFGQYNKGSKARAIMEMIADEFSGMYSNIVFNVSQSFLKYAVGDMLDNWGEMFGVSRIKSSAAVSFAAENNIKFYANNGQSFGDINGGADIIIPRNTVLGTVGGVEYTVDSDLTLPLDAGTVYITARSATPGTKGNIDVGELVTHNVSNYLLSNSNQLLVGNEYAVGNGVDDETDDNYRYRISNRLLELERGNLTSIYVSLLALPGVRDVKIYPYANGIGTADIYVFGFYPNQSSSIRDFSQALVDRYCSAGDSVRVLLPNVVEISLQTVVKFKPTRISGLNQFEQLSYDTKTSIINSATDSLISYFKGLDVDSPVVIDKLVQVIMGADDRILDLGSVATKPFDYLLITRPLYFGGSQTTEMVDNYVPDKGEWVTLKYLDLQYE